MPGIVDVMVRCDASLPFELDHLVMPKHKKKQNIQNQN